MKIQWPWKKKQSLPKEEKKPTLEDLVIIPKTPVSDPDRPRHGYIITEDKPEDETPPSALT